MFKLVEQCLQMDEQEMIRGHLKKNVFLLLKVISASRKSSWSGNEHPE